MLSNRRLPNQISIVEWCFCCATPPLESGNHYPLCRRDSPFWWTLRRLAGSKSLTCGGLRGRSRIRAGDLLPVRCNTQVGARFGCGTFGRLESSQYQSDQP